MWRITVPTGEGERQNHYCPVQKNFAPLRLCFFALKMTPAGAVTDKTEIGQRR
jgi:hypothetical protein